MSQPAVRGSQYNFDSRRSSKMDSINGYGSDSDSNSPSDASPQGPKPQAVTKRTVNAAPDVSADVMAVNAYITDPSNRMVMYNPPVDELARAIQGPVNPYARPLDNVKNVPTGMAEAHVMTEHDFENQRRTFIQYGYAVDPSTEGTGMTAFFGDAQAAMELNGATVNDKISKMQKEKFRQRQRLPKGDPGLESYLGPWAGYIGEGHMTDQVAPSEEDLLAAHKTREEAAEKQKASVNIHGNEKSVFHGDQEYDSLGRSYVHIPRDLDIDLKRDPGDHECFAPKKHIHTWTGHTQGVNAIRFFPRSGHLLLSASADTTVRLWDVYHDRKCLRTFHGHMKSVRDIAFNNDGTQFLSASYDNSIKLWDTETGQCVTRFEMKRTPYVVKFHPNPDRQHVFLAGCSDRKIVQFDCKTGKPQQTYDQHTGPVNTITFVDRNRRFVTTSDDKSIRMWEFGVPVTIKYISEPHMHSMPAVALHPEDTWMACQAMSNQILVYGAAERLRMHRKKVFSGHQTSGYACQLTFSPDGRYLASGDANGGLFVWDWNTTKLIRNIKAHTQVTMGCIWHPQEPSRVATCSWDGTIKYWD